MEKIKLKFWNGIDPEFRAFMTSRARLDDYINVYLFDTYEEMYKFCNTHEHRKTSEDYSGRTFMFLKVVRDEDNNIVSFAPLNGFIALTKEKIDAGIIAHEITHAVLGYFERKLDNPHGLIDDSVVASVQNDKLKIPLGFIETNDISYEELFCYMTGNFNKSVVRFVANSFTKEVN